MASISNEEFLAREVRVTRRMEKEHLDGLFVYGNPDVFHGPGAVRYMCDYSYPMGEWAFFISKSGNSKLLLGERLRWICNERVGSVGLPMLKWQ